MDKDTVIGRLKDVLRKEVSRLCRSDNRLWKEPIVDTVRELHEANWHAVFFGGTLRSLLTSRLWCRALGRPRDIDIVIRDAGVSSLRRHFKRYVSRETRFGGLQLRRMNWQFDVWPLEQTWALVQDEVKEPSFDDLPNTTFFNLEAIAVEVWPQRGRARVVYSGDNQFFDGITNRFLEINREANPFPVLCVTRALLLAGSLNFCIGPKLSHYIVRHGTGLSGRQLDEIQEKHYGNVRESGDKLRYWIRHIDKSLMAGPESPIFLPIARKDGVLGRAKVTR
jgi:hypothetical protein